MPPLQKAGIIVSSGLITGIGHSIIANVNRYRNWDENNSVTNTTSTIGTKDTVNAVNSNINKFMDSTTPTSPLENLLFDIEALNYICLSLMFILIIQISFRFYFKDNVKLNLSSVLGDNLNKSIEYYINKTIMLNKKMSHIYIWFAIILIIIGLSL